VLSQLDTCCDLFSESAVKLISDLPRVQTSAEDIKKAIRHASVCFHNGTVYRDGKQEALSGQTFSSRSTERAQWLGSLVKDPDEAKKSFLRPAECDYDRFANNLITFSPTLPESLVMERHQMSEVFVNLAPKSQLMCQIAARGATVPTGQDKVRKLADAIRRTEIQPGYGPPRIQHPHYLAAGAKYEPPAEEEEADDLKPAPRPNPETEWPESGQGDGWIIDPVQVGLFAPQVLLKNYMKWFDAPHRKEQGITLTKALVDGSRMSANKNYTLHYKSEKDDGSEILFRCELMHSMPSSNKKSTHFGSVYTVVRCEVQTDKMGRRFVSCIKGTECTCTGKNSEQCYHNAVVMYMAENIIRPQGSLIPESKTAKTKAFNDKSNSDSKFNKLSPLAMLPTTNNKRKLSDEVRSKPRVPQKRFSGDGGRLAGGYQSLPIDHTMDLRNDPDIVQVRQLLHEALGGCVAKKHWPARWISPDRFKIVPICNDEYLFGGGEDGGNDENGRSNDADGRVGGASSDCESGDEMDLKHNDDDTSKKQASTCSERKNAQLSPNTMKKRSKYCFCYTLQKKGNVRCSDMLQAKVTWLVCDVSEDGRDACPSRGFVCKFWWERNNIDSDFDEILTSDSPYYCSEQCRQTASVSEQ
jgi:hypothetical protein